MPKGPKGENRPADVISNAVKVARIATGEDDEDDTLDPSKNLEAQKLGRKGGRARALSLTREQREEIARTAAQARWKKKD
jgi:hypothetical protein